MVNMFKKFNKYWALILVLCMILNISTASQIFAAEKDNQLNSNTGVRKDIYKDIVAKDKSDNLQIDTLNKSAVVSPSIKTDLSDMTTKSDKITFDLWAKDPDESKIQISDISVTNNGEPIGINWDDKEKTSYTLELEVGRNNVKIDVKYNGEDYVQEYTIIREEAEEGEAIGSFTFTMEAFTVGLGYLIEPIQVDIHKGRNSAQELDQIIRDNGYDYSNTGILESNFYLQYVSNDANKIYKTTPKIPDVLKEKLNAKYDEKDYRDGKLGEFDFNFMSGWMYAVNNVFPNVGFADKYLQDGDVMRVQFTLAYGNDIGGSDAVGGGSRNEFFPKVNKDKLTKKVAEINSNENRKKYLSNQSIKSAYDTGIEILKKVDASQEEIDRAYGQLANARVEFKDLSNHKWAVEAVNSMAAKGIIGGKIEGAFDPAANITRAETAVMLYRLYDLIMD